MPTLFQMVISPIENWSEGLKYFNFVDLEGLDTITSQNQATLRTPVVIKCADLNKHTFSLLHIEEKVYMFKSAHFN